MIGALLILSASLAPPALSEPLPTIELLATSAISSGTSLDKRRVGGLSGLTYHQGRWFAVTDEKEDATRLYELRIDVDPAARSVTANVIAVHTLDAPDISDAEGLASDGELLYVAFERPCAAAAFTLQTGNPTLALTRRFVTPEPVGSRFRKNRAFESILVRPRADACEIWAITESAIDSDGPEASFSRPALSRAVIWSHDATVALRQHAYVTLPAPPNTLAFFPSYNSLADACGLDESRFLTLERSFSIASGYDAAVRLVTIRHDETDTTDTPSLDPAPPALIPLHTETIATLQALGAPSTVNYEAIALGPPLRADTDARLLIILADDNFGADGQPTNAILAFRFTDPISSSRSAPRADDR
ncbi:MAG: esterase-like activity of phytase family protein [Phycisphaerales bacterium]